MAYRSVVALNVVFLMNTARAEGRDRKGQPYLTPNRFVTVDDLTFNETSLPTYTGNKISFTKEQEASILAQWRNVLAHERNIDR